MSRRYPQSEAQQQRETLTLRFVLWLMSRHRIIMSFSWYVLTACSHLDRGVDYGLWQDYACNSCYYLPLNSSHTLFNLLYIPRVGRGTSEVFCISFLRLRRHSLIDSTLISSRDYRGESVPMSSSSSIDSISVVAWWPFEQIFYTITGLTRSALLRSWFASAATAAPHDTLCRMEKFLSLF
jgi:hypothetical protein